MPQYQIELNEETKYFKCSDCGQDSITVGGSVSKNNAAHAVYLAGLMIGHKQPSVWLTLSIGGWEQEIAAKRKWVFLEARPTIDSYQIMVREPEESLYCQDPMLGQPLSRSEALSSSWIGEFLSVADFIALNDPAVKSYLSGEEVSHEGRKPAI